MKLGINPKILLQVSASIAAAMFGFSANRSPTAMPIGGYQQFTPPPTSRRNHSFKHNRRLELKRSRRRDYQCRH
jgi:hypothetical protein